MFFQARTQSNDIVDEKCMWLVYMTRAGCSWQAERGATDEPLVASQALS